MDPLSLAAGAAIAALFIKRNPHEMSQGVGKIVKTAANAVPTVGKGIGGFLGRVVENVKTGYQEGRQS